MRVLIVALLFLFAFPMAQVSDPGTWKRLPNPDGAKIQSLMRSGENLYASVEIIPRDGMQHGALFRSSDAGLTWEPVRPEVFKGPPAFAVDGERIYARRGDSLVVTAPGVEGWKAVAPLHSGRIIAEHGLLIRDAYANNGLELSSDSGKTWRVFQLPRGSDPYLAFLAITRTHFFLAFNYSNEVWRTGDRGISWQLVFKDSSGQFSPSTIAVLDDFLFISNLKSGYRSLDMGNTWEPVPIEGKPAAAGGKAVVLGGNAGLYLTNSAGRSWTRLSSAPVENVGALAVDGNRIYLWNNATRAKPASLQFSGDDGQTWTESAQPPGIELPTGCSSILFSPTHIHLVMIDTGNAVQKKKAIVLIERASPAIWRVLPMQGLVYHYGFIPVAVKGPMIFTVRKSGMLYSDDTGHTWKSLNRGMGQDSNQIISLALQGERLVAGTATGYLFSISVPDPGAVGLAPNPGSGDARVGRFALHAKRYSGDPEGMHFSYHLPYSAKVTLRLFDIQGRLLEQINRKSDKGGHRIRWEIPAAGEKFFFRFVAFGEGGTSEEATGWFSR